MMVELVGSAESRTHGVVESVLETLVADSTSLPWRVYLDDGDPSWRCHAVAMPVEARRRSVLVTASDARLVDALSLEIGGAARLPVSTPSMEVACESAATSEAWKVVPMATQGVLDALMAGSSDIQLVGWWPHAFWQGQVGPIRPVNRLVEIAERLTIFPLILPGPILVVEGRGQAEIEAARSDDGRRPGSSWIPAPPRIVELSTSELSAGGQIRIGDVLAAANAKRHEADGSSELNLPVLEIPSGRMVGRWALARGVTVDGSLWCASPRQQDRDGSFWEIVATDGSSELIAESTSLDRDDVAGQSVIRAPGFVGAALRHGSPGGLLIEGLARHAARAGRPIWVPSVDGEGVRFLLGLPGPIWVDGPGVPG